MHSMQRIRKCTSKRRLSKQHHNHNTTHTWCAHHPYKLAKPPSTTNLISINRHLQSYVQNEHTRLTITHTHIFLYTKKMDKQRSNILKTFKPLMGRHTNYRCPNNTNYEIPFRTIHGNHTKKLILASHMHESQLYLMP
jgi:hypothetical protein